MTEIEAAAECSGNGSGALSTGIPLAANILATTAVATAAPWSDFRAAVAVVTFVWFSPRCWSGSSSRYLEHLLTARGVRPGPVTAAGRGWMAPICWERW